VLAIDPTDGKIKWGYQYTPNDPYDFDEMSEHPIINAKVNGEDRKRADATAGRDRGMRGGRRRDLTTKETRTRSR
jgi:alcohol dehydrogenase (cytochrome c)